MGNLVRVGCWLPVTQSLSCSFEGGGEHGVNVGKGSCGSKLGVGKKLLL